MKTNYSSVFKNNLRLLCLLAVLTFPAIAGAQSFKTQVKYVDPTEQALHAGLQLTDIQPLEFDELASKMESNGMYSVTKEYYAQKNTGTIVLKSNSKGQIKDLESLFKHVGIHTVDFNGKTISSQQIESNYTPVNKTEVRQIERRN
ncbi:MAG: hypothetical protein K0S12_2525 [Bacteroidetes bacterium]|jgi:hypothetical protein|nr:hypothetical protein [Bacteroidota bacterium]